MMNALIFFLLVAIILESSLITIPLTLLSLLFIAVITKKSSVFALAFIAGLLLDLLTLKTVGISSLYFITFIYLVLLYQSKFEIETPTFIAIFSFIGSLGFLLINNSGYAFQQAILGSLIAFISFLVFLLRRPKEAQFV